MRYNVCGLSLDSVETFPELTPSDSSQLQGSLCLRRDEKITASGEAIRPAIKWTLPDGRPFLVSSKTENGYVLHFENLADFFIDQSASEVRYSPRPGVPANSIRHLILDNVIAFVLSLRGYAVLHSSAVVTPFGTCAFAANTGIGKSTLAASFQHAGYSVLTDDCLRLESDAGSVYGIASYPGVRLREDSLSLVNTKNTATLSVAHYNSKRRFGAGLFAAGRHRLSAIYFVERPRVDGELTDDPRIEELSGHDSLLMMVRYLFCLDPYEPSMLVRQFKILEHVLSQVRILRLIIPDDFSALPRVREAVISDLRARSQLGAPAIQ